VAQEFAIHAWRRAEKVKGVAAVQAVQAVQAAMGAADHQPEAEGRLPLPPLKPRPHPLRRLQRRLPTPISLALWAAFFRPQFRGSHG